jgi:hypothetical protein
LPTAGACGIWNSDGARRPVGPGLRERACRSRFRQHLSSAASLTLDAERDPDATFAVNVDAVQHLIAAVSATGLASSSRARSRCSAERFQTPWTIRSGKLRLPSRDEMDAEIARHRREVERTYVGSPRYTLEVDFRSYARQLRKALATGRA